KPGPSKPGPGHLAPPDWRTTDEDAERPVVAVRRLLPTFGTICLQHWHNNLHRPTWFDIRG
ncbi:MAG: hypothetical protein QOF35_2030, partial [Actinomycetota bacterium]|nr:hypothetical protein [Actinomycetota bacterium]